MPMSKAESEDIAKELNEIKGQYSLLHGLVENVNKSLHEISSNLINLNTTLTHKIEDGNAKLASEIQRIESSFATEVESLKTSHEEIRRDFQEHQARTEINIEKLRAEERDHRNEFDASSIIIRAQAAQIQRLEKECHRGLQHGRGWNIEIDGFPQQVGDDPESLRKAFLNLCEIFNIDVNYEDIETIHRLPGRQPSKPIIVRFISRESVREIHSKKSRLKNLGERVGELEIAGLTEESKIYIRPSQCSYYRCLAFNCRVLKRKGLLTKVNVGDDGRISIKLLDGSTVKVLHESTLVKNFPDFTGFNFIYDEKDKE